MPSQSNKYQTQWAAQFLVAAELTSRGYLVNFSLGNAKFTDVQVETSDGRQYSVDVKGQSTKNYWFIRQRKHKDNQYFILVYVPRSKSVRGALLPKEAQYFILPSAEMDREMALERNNFELENQKRRNEGKEPLKEIPGLGGIPFKLGLKYENNWDSLPKMNP